jgi:response regulator RpfG family c-di-GMP phosphodiesterase
MAFSSLKRACENPNARVLLIDACGKARNVRLQFLRGHGVEVETADSLEEARCKWQPKQFDLVLIDVRKYPSEETLGLVEQMRETASRERIAFLSGPPQYLSLCWPYEVLATDEPHPQWAATVKQFVAAAA